MYNIIINVFSLMGAFGGGGPREISNEATVRLTPEER